jgi:hypothetical protein
MEKNKKLRCPLGIPGGIVVALIGLASTVWCAWHSEWHDTAISFALLLLAVPFIRVTMMVHSANDRLDELEKKAENKS